VRGDRGQAIVEFALVLPTLLVVALAIVLVAELGVARMALQHATAEAARAGALTNEGFFDNVGKTRRDGFEANVAGAAGERITWSLDYTYLDATFRESFAVMSPNHPEAAAGEIAVQSGDRLPLIPQQLLKAGVRFAATDALTFGADVLASSGAYFRGDEGNLLDELDGYSVLGVRAEYRKLGRTPPAGL